MSAKPVRNDEVLYRRVTADQVIDGKITSAAFRSRHEDGCSTASADHVSQVDCLKGWLGRGLVSVTGADVKASGARAIRSDADPGHVSIVGEGKKFPKELSTRAILLVAPTIVPPPPPTPPL